MNLDFRNILKPTELTKAYNEIEEQSSYHKDMRKYTEVAYAAGFEGAMRFMDKDTTDMIIENYKKDDSNISKLIIRLWEDK